MRSRSVQDMLKICSRYVQDILMICSRYVRLLCDCSSKAHRLVRNIYKGINLPQNKIKI